MAERRKLGDMLVEAGLISEFQLNTALSDQKQWGRPLGITLVRLEFVSEADLTRVLSEQLDLPVIELDGKVAPPDLLELLPHEIASKHRCLPLAVSSRGSTRDLYLGMSDPTDLEVVGDIGFRTGHSICPVLVGGQQLEEAIDRSYRAVDLDDELPKITLEDIESPGARSTTSRRAQKQKPSRSRQQISLPSSEEPELVLTAHADDADALFADELDAIMDAIAERGAKSQGTVLQALIRLMISKKMIDPDELITAIRSIAFDRE